MAAWLNRNFLRGKNQLLLYDTPTSYWKKVQAISERNTCEYERRDVSPGIPGYSCFFVVFLLLSCPQKAQKRRRPSGKQFHLYLSCMPSMLLCCLLVLGFFVGCLFEAPF